MLSSEKTAKAVFSRLSRAIDFRRFAGLNAPMSESIKAELEALETVGRVTASGQRPVHAEFGFEEIQRDPEPAVATPAGANVAASLDDAWSRLKRRIAPE